MKLFTCLIALAFCLYSPQGIASGKPSSANPKDREIWCPYVSSIGHRERLRNFSKSRAKPVETLFNEEEANDYLWQVDRGLCNEAERALRGVYVAAFPEHACFFDDVVNKILWDGIIASAT